MEVTGTTHKTGESACEGHWGKTQYGRSIILHLWSDIDKAFTVRCALCRLAGQQQILYTSAGLQPPFTVVSQLLQLFSRLSLVGLSLRCAPPARSSHASAILSEHAPYPFPASFVCDIITCMWEINVVKINVIKITVWELQFQVKILKVSQVNKLTLSLTWERMNALNFHILTKVNFQTLCKYYSHC